MIQPKFRFLKDNSWHFDDKLFIDREEPKSLFRSSIETFHDDYNILMYYGVGGVGKSRLLVQIKDIFVNRFPNNICFHIDLADSNCRTVGEALMKFTETVNKKDIDFVAFNLAYAIYFKRKHCGEGYSRDIGNKNVDSILNIIDIFDGGYSRAAVDSIGRIVDYTKKFFLDKYIIDDLKNFDSMALHEIEARLPAYFEYDVSRYIRKHPECRILFTIDTFEALNINQKEEIHRRRNELWVQDLISNFSKEEVPNCIFVIFGRDKLTWDDEWKKYITTYQLRDFDSNWASEYLIRQHITDPVFSDAIISSSKGHPFYLYLAAKTYCEICSRGNSPKIEDFQGGHKEIISRFIYNLTDEEIRILKYLSIPNFFSQEIFEYLLGEYHIANDPIIFFHITSYSFIKEESEEFYMHSIMRNGLLRTLTDMLKNKLHCRMMQYYIKRYKETNVNKYLIELFYHASNCMSVSEFNSWLLATDAMKTLLLYQVNGDQYVIISITEYLIKQYGIKNLNIQIVNLYIDAVHLGGDYQGAVNICKNYLANYSWDEIKMSESLSRMRIRMIHHSMFFCPVDKLIAEAERLIICDSITKHEKQYYELLFLLGGNLGVLSGDFEYAQDWLTKFRDILVHTDSTNQKLRLVRKMSDLAIYRGMPEQAISDIQAYIPDRLSITNRYHVYLIGSLGEAYRKKGLYDDARNCFMLLKEKSSQKNLIGWVYHADLALCMLNYEQGSYQEVIASSCEICKKYAKINHRWGQINSKTVEFLAKVKCGGILSCKDEISILREEAQALNYNYNVYILDKILNNQTEYFQLFFL